MIYMNNFMILKRKYRIIKFCDNPKCDHHIDYNPFKLDYLKIYKGNQVKEIYNYKYYIKEKCEFGYKPIQLCEICASAVDLLNNKGE
jgi:hypothetical protein